MENIKKEMDGEMKMDGRNKLTASTMGSIFKEEETEIKLEKKETVDMKRIANMNRRIEKSLGLRGNKENPTIERGLDKYVSYMNEKKVFKVSFTTCSRNGELSMLDESGIYVVMSAAATKEGFPYFVPTLSRKMLSYEFDVIVQSVDVENNRVYVGSSHDARQAELASKRNLEKELKNAISNKIYPTVWGRVVKVEKERAYVDILDKGIRGMITASHWNKGYVRNLNSVCKKDDYFQFQVTYVRSKLKDKPTQFLLDRRNLSENPWDLIPEDLFPVGSVCEVKCIELPIGKSFWWGVSEATPGIEIMGDYPSSNERRLDMMQGITYMCKVTDISINREGVNNCFKVVPFAVSDFCKTDYERIMVAKYSKGMK